MQERETRGPEHECVQDALTIISVDNIDFQHSYARVFCGRQTSSWHGTTVQAVQPKIHFCSSSVPHASNTCMQGLEATQMCVSKSTCGESTAISTTTVTCEESRHTSCAIEDKSFRLAQRKRASTTRSPCLSPLKLSSSPLTKKRRRARTGIEGISTSSILSPVYMPVGEHHHISESVDLQYFKLNPTEECTINNLQKEMNMYILQKHTHASSDTDILHLQDYLKIISPVKVERSKVVYLQVLDAVSENRDTIMTVLFDLHHRFIDGQGKKFIVLAADAKLYEVVQSVKYEYGEELKWLLPFPGDWHMLKNFQIALMKPYFEMGLKELARISGYPVAAIQNCSQFKQTHHFLMEVWQAIYEVIVKRFIEAETESGSTSSHLTDIVKSASLGVKSSEAEFMARLAHLQEKIQESSYHENFQHFLDTIGTVEPKWKFWIQFVFKDALAYIGLYLAIRSGNWLLRLASIKLMAPVFCAFDHHTYKKLIAQHLADVYSLPEEVLSALQEGGFAVSLSGSAWHSVSLDEAHEMKINKECKTSIVHPSKEYINKVAGYIPYRAKCMENLKENTLP